MIVSEPLRFWLLAATGVTFAGFAIWAAAEPRGLARLLGFELASRNASSEFHAIYVGVFLAQAALCFFAANRVSDAALGDLCAAFLLLQPVGRVLAGLRGDFPEGVLRLLFAAEVVGGLAILGVRPV